MCFQQCCLLRRTGVLTVLARVHRLQRWQGDREQQSEHCLTQTQGSWLHTDICGRKSCLIEKSVEYNSKSVWHFLSAPAKETSPFYRCWKWTKDQAATQVCERQTLKDNQWLADMSDSQITYQFSYFTEGSFHSSFKESVLQLNML